MTQEQLRMQMLAGIITEGQYKAKLNENTLKRNQDYFSKYTLLKDPNLGKDQMVSSPFTPESIVSALKPLINKSGVYQGDPEGMTSVVKEFKNWLQSNMDRYDMFNNDSLTAREIFDQVYGDYVSEVNELNEEDSMGKVGEPGGFMGFAQHLKDKGINIEKEETNTIPLDATTKRYVIKRLKEILDEYDEEGIEELQNAGFFEQDFEEELVVEFGGDYDSVNVSPELSDFISNLAY
jgi:hypothetical protein